METIQISKRSQILHDPRDSVDIQRQPQSYSQTINHSPQRYSPHINHSQNLVSYSPPAKINNNNLNFQQKNQNNQSFNIFHNQNPNYLRDNNIGQASRVISIKRKTQNIFFPFGKDREKMLRVMDNHLHQDQQQNKRILQQFRIKAIMSKQRGKYNNQTTNFITQSMMPSAQYIEYLNQQKKNQYLNSIRYKSIDQQHYQNMPRYSQNPENLYQPFTKKRIINPEPVHLMRPQLQRPYLPPIQKISVGINTPDFDEIQRHKLLVKQKKRKRKAFQINTIDKFNSIQKIMKNINEHLDKNTEILENYSKSHIFQEIEQKQIQKPLKKIKTLPVHYHNEKEQYQEQELIQPKVKYSQYENNNHNIYDKKNISQALTQLRRYKKKMDSYSKC